jgi:hypothetical protein
MDTYRKGLNYQATIGKEKNNNVLFLFSLKFDEG